MSHVTEHLRSPISVLNAVRNLLSREGIFLMVVPNVDSWCYRILGEKWMAADLPFHIWFFSQENGMKILEKACFEVTHIVYKWYPRSISKAILHAPHRAVSILRYASNRHADALTFYAKRRE